MQWFPFYYYPVVLEVFELLRRLRVNRHQPSMFCGLSMGVSLQNLRDLAWKPNGNIGVWERRSYSETWTLSSVHLQLSRLCLIFVYYYFKIKHSVVTGRAEGVIGNLFCACHLVSHYCSTGRLLIIAFNLCTIRITHSIHF